MVTTESRGQRGINGRGSFIYKDCFDNHVIWPGRRPALDKFLRQTFKGVNHKMKHSRSGSSEDALTWSCFDTLKNVAQGRRTEALGQLWEQAYGDMPAPAGFETSTIHIGKTYGIGKDRTEVDLSFEGNGFLVLVEAKLYSPMSQAGNGKPDNQIARKLTIGLRHAREQGKEFYFILLDSAPSDCLARLNPGVSLERAGEKAAGFGAKWVTSYWFARYKYGHRGSLTPLKTLLSKKSLNTGQAAQIAKRMGWITWADVFKVVLRAVIPLKAVAVAA